MKQFVTILIVLATALMASAAEPVDFNRDIRPIFNRRCTSCHGGVKRKGGFSLLYRSETLKPAKSGDAPLTPGDPELSGIHYRITTDDKDDSMPPEGDPLTAEEIATIRQWITEGAVYAEHWAYVAPERTEAPKVKHKKQVRNHIDAFILKRLESEKLKLSPEAPKHVLQRRLYLDLTGLPPTVKDVDRFMADTSKDGYEKEVDRLLASPRFGERWAAMWLDLARYADTQGYEKDAARSISPYRDWVIKAFNEDLNFRDFTIAQLAGDLLPDADDSHRVATGFHRNTMCNSEGGTDNEEFRVAAVVDRVNTTWEVWMGTSYSCVQCHSHPYDPFTHAEYYEVMGFFNSTADADRNNDAPTLNVFTDQQREDRTRLSAEVEQGRKALDEAIVLLGDKPQVAWEENILASEDTEERKAIPANILKLMQKAAEKRSQKDKDAIQNHYRSTEPTLKDLHGALTEKQQKLNEIKGVSTLVMEELATPRETHVFNGGNWMSHGDKVSRDTPAVLPALPEEAPRNRLGLARWIVSPENPLTARVAVNRFWEQIFGNGIVASVADFGTQGFTPTHPALLDDLAVRFVHEQKWSVKALLKSFVMSATYRQSSHVDKKLLELDPQNRLLARGARYRLSAEQIRDQALAVAGTLSDKMYGPSVMPPQPDDIWKIVYSGKTWKNAEGQDRYRRGLYTYWRRTSPYPSMESFDVPSREFCVNRRIRTNTPLQALVTLNDPAFVEAAQAMAGRILEEGGNDLRSRIRYGYKLVLGREADPAEVDRLATLYHSEEAFYAQNMEYAVAFGASQTAPVERAAWTAVANVFLNLDEVLTRE